MSVTTTQNARLTTLRHTLDITNPQPSSPSSAPPPTTRPETTSSNPPDWETQYRRVPPYRPINPELINGERSVVNNEIERNFIRVMFGGVWLQAASAQAWRATGGRVFGERIFRVGIGGEW